MEKLDAQKFENYRLNNRQLNYVHAGEGSTGGGVDEVYAPVTGESDHYSYSSDYVNSSGATFYHNYQYSHSQTRGGGTHYFEGR